MGAQINLRVLKLDLPEVSVVPIILSQLVSNLPDSLQILGLPCSVLKVKTTFLSKLTTLTHLKSLCLYNSNCISEIPVEDVISLFVETGKLTSLITFKYL